MLRIVTDGAADIPPKWEQEYDIQIVPVNIHFGERTFVQYVDMDIDGFYKEVKANKNFPKTSQPSPHQFVELYKKIAQKGDTILSIHVTSKLSGTFASSVAAAEELKGTFNIIPVDSLNGSLGIGFMCREARKMERAGKSVDKIVKYLKTVRNNIMIVLTLDTLDYARRSGRVGTLSATLASVLDVKPIALLSDGLVNMVDKVRTRRAAIERIIEMGKTTFGDHPIYLGVVHASDETSGRALLEQAKSRLNVRDVEMTDLSVSLAVNFGPGAVGLILYPAK